MKFRILYIILFGLCLLSAGRGNAQVSHEQLLQVGDSLLYEMLPNQARQYYDSVANSPEVSNLNKNQAIYKTGYSYLHEKEDFLALAYFTEVQLFFEPQTPGEAALMFLVNLEVDVLAYNAVGVDYNEEFLKESFQKWNKLLKKNDCYRANYLMGEIFYQRLQYNQAHFYYMRNIGEEIKDRYLAENTYYNLLWLNRNMYNHRSAIEYGNLLFSDEIRYINEPRAFRFFLHSYMGMKDYTKCIRLFIDNQEMYDSPNRVYRYEYVYSLIRTARCYDRINEVEKADSLFHLASEYRIILVENPWLISSLYNDWAISFKRRGQLNRALELIKLGNQMLDSIGYQNEKADWTLLQKARLHRDLGDFETAFDILDEALEDWNPERRAFVSSKDWTRYANYLRTKYFTYRKYWEEKGDLDKLIEAHAGFKDVLQIYLDIQSQLSGENSISVVREIRMDYENLFLTAFNLYQVTGNEQYLKELFDYSEKGRYIHYKNQLDFNNFLKEEEVEDKLKAMERSYRLSIERIRFLLDNEEVTLSSENEKQLHEDLVITQKKYDSILLVLYEEKEAISKVSEKENTVNDIQRVLESNQAVVSYFITERRLFLLYLDKVGKEVHEIKLDENIQTLANKFGISLQLNPAISKSNLADFKGQSNTLYNFLIKPVEHKIMDKSLFVIPDKELSFISYDVLLADTLGNSFGELNYLIRNNPISELYTFSQLINKRSYLDSYSKFVAFSPDYAAYQRGSYAPLIGAKREIEKLDEYFKGKPFIDKAATSDNFFKYSSRADIIHVAAHTKVDKNTLSHSQFLLAEEDKPLTLFEIYGMEFKAKLLVLSSCNTGKGKLKAGDGAINLARGFFYAGIKNVVLTKWAISDNSSAQLMGDFYRQLSEQKASDEALQLSKIQYLETADPLKLHPYYWSAYVSIGKPVELKKSYGVKLTLLVISSLVLIILYKIKKRTTL